MVKTPCKPRNALVLIRIPQETEQRSETGLYLLNFAGMQFRPCEVVDVGNGTPEIGGADTNDLKAGMRVLAKVGEKRLQPGGMAGAISWSCVPLSREASEETGLFLINQQDILAILDDENKNLKLT